MFPIREEDCKLCIKSIKFGIRNIGYYIINEIKLRQINEINEEKAKIQSQLEELKRDFIHNLDIIKDLEGKIREFDEENSSLKRELNLAKNQISDLALKKSEAEEKTLKELHKSEELK